MEEEKSTSGRNETKKVTVDVRTCIEDLGGRWIPDENKCLVESDVPAIANEEKISIVPKGQNRGIILDKERVEDVSDKAEKHYLYKIEGKGTNEEE